MVSGEPLSLGNVEFRYVSSTFSNVLNNFTRIQAEQAYTIYTDVSSGHLQIACISRENGIMLVKRILISINQRNILFNLILISIP